MGEAPLRPVQRDSRLDVARGLAISADDPVLDASNWFATRVKGTLNR